MPQYQSHALADLFPLIEGAEFDELVSSIKAHGLREPITLYNNLILDGRNRYRACEASGVEPRFEEFTGEDPRAFVADKNLHRRHLNPSQIGMIAARMGGISIGNPKLQHPMAEISTTPALSSRQAEKIMGVNRTTILHANRVLNEGTKEEIQAVERGDASVSSIAKQIKARIPKEQRVLKSTAQADALRRNAKIWDCLREALELLSSMPQATDVVQIARSYDKRTTVISDRLPQSIEWLTEFQTAWNAKKKDAA